MFLQLGHQKLEVFASSRQLVSACYAMTKTFPSEEKFALTQQIRRASISVYLNIAEGCSRKSLAERKRFFELSRGSLIEIDAALDVAVDLNYANPADLQAIGKYIVECFKMLTALLR